jgi:hypothetical protein
LVRFIDARCAFFITFEAVSVKIHFKEKYIEI